MPQGVKVAFYVLGALCAILGLANLVLLCVR